MHYINYKEQELPVTIDFAVIKTVCSKLNITLSQFEKAIDNPEHLAVIFAEGLKRGHKLESKEFKYDDEQTLDIMCECVADFLLIFTQDVLKTFTPTSKKK